MKNVLEFGSSKREGRAISMVTSYDHWSARVINGTDIDCILVGDSVAMVVYGHPSTLAATPEMVARHTEAVVRGAPDKFVIADMPFLSFRKGVAAAMETVGLLMAAGAGAVKIEGVDGHEDVIRRVVESGVPVMGHLGLTPQSLHQFGGFRVQGRGSEAAEHIYRQAMKLEELGCFSVVLECVPEKLAERITSALRIPTIGIGAGRGTDGQVLVLQDLLGVSGFKPKFLSPFMEGEAAVSSALQKFHDDVLERRFPREEHCYQ